MFNHNIKNKELKKTRIALFVVLSAVVLRDVTIGHLSPVWIALVVVSILIASLKGKTAFRRRSKISDDHQDVSLVKQT